MASFLFFIKTLANPLVFNTIIFSVFIYYSRQIWRVRTKAKNWTKTIFTEKKSLDQVKPLDILFQEYKKTFYYNINSFQKTEYYASEFFNTTSIFKQIKRNIQAIHSASGILVGLGLLGTFLGLTISIYGFDTSSSENIEKGIQSLLSGMGTAFSTSLTGMTLSIAFTVFEKRQTNRMHRFINKLCSNLDSQYLISEIEISEYKTKHLLKIMAFKNEEDQLILPGNLLRDIYRETTYQTGTLRTLVTDLSDRLTDGFSEIMSEQFESLNGTLGDLTFKMDELAKNIQQPADDMTRSIVEDLQSSMKQMALDFRESLSGDATNNLENLAKNLDQASTALLSFPDQLKEMTNNMKVSFENIQLLIEKQSQNASNVSSLAIQEMKSKLDESADTMSLVLSQVKTAIEGITQNSSQINQNMIGTIESSIHSLNESTQTNNEAINKHVQQQINYMIEQFNSLSNDLNNKYSEITNLHSQLNTDSSSVLEQYNASIARMVQANNEISQTAKHFIDLQKESKILNTGLISVSQQIGDVSNKLNELQNSIFTKQDIYLTKYDEVIDEVNRVLSSISESMQEYSEKFKTVEAGLSGVFNELNQGLNQYTTTVSSGTKEFLTSYTSSIEKATNSLANAIQEHTDLTDELKEIVESIKK